MANYKLTIKKSAARELKNIPQKDVHRVVRRIQTLADNPRPFGSEKLSGMPCHRIRQGNYRIIYSIDDTSRIVDIIKIGHRREIYRF